MTSRALRIWRSDKPSMVGARVLPMTREDAQFWQLLRAMRASPEGTRPVGARSAKPIARGDARSAAGAQTLLSRFSKLFSRRGR